MTVVESHRPEKDASVSHDSHDRFGWRTWQWPLVGIVTALVVVAAVVRRVADASQR